MKREEEVRLSNEAMVRMMEKYNSFVKIEELVKLGEEYKKLLDKDGEKCYTIDQFDLFKRLT